MIDDEPRYVTALGETDVAGGWRENKASGGVLIDIESGETVLRGLSMPHSPRWYDGRMWVLESGKGTISVADLDAGTVETVAELPGFTRGLLFAGGLAFIGLSQVRETATFGGLPLMERLDERLCGVWAVNPQSGQIVGFLRFEELVQEVFDVELLAGVRYPEIAEEGSDAATNSFMLPEAAQPGRPRMKPDRPGHLAGADRDGDRGLRDRERLLRDQRRDPPDRARLPHRRDDGPVGRQRLRPHLRGADRHRRPARRPVRPPPRVLHRRGDLRVLLGRSAELRRPRPG